MTLKKTKYICLEGEEGMGKSTQVKKLVEYLRNKRYSVLSTREPGTDHLPLTMALRKIMLDAQYKDQITCEARELISQSIRSIHLNKLIYPAIDGSKYDFIIQDRGILSGLAYGVACGNNIEWLSDLAYAVTCPKDPYKLYNKIIYLTGNTDIGLKRASKCKQEFKAGDAMESRGNSFINKVSDNFKEMSQWFNADIIDIDGKDIDAVFNEILVKLNLV